MDLSTWVSDFWTQLNIAWEMGTVEQIYNQFVHYSQAYHSSGTIPTEKVIETFSEKVHKLTLVKEYCTQVNVVEMIKAEIPYDKLADYCNIPDGLTADIAKRFLN